MKEEKIRNMLEKALYFYTDNATENELKEQFEWYKVNNVEDLIDIMFESYLDNYTKKELIERINSLFYLDNMSISDKLECYKEFFARNYKENSEYFDLIVEVKE